MIAFLSIYVNHKIQHLPPAKAREVSQQINLIMKIFYNTYRDIFAFASKAFKGTVLGMSRLLWVVVLLVATVRDSHTNGFLRLSGRSRW